VIVTLTLNPSLDRTVSVDLLTRGAVLRTTEPTLEPGGKGVNLSRALTLNGTPSIAILPVGGSEGAELSALLALTSVSTRYVVVSGRTRSNLTVSEADGTVTKLNEPGSELDALDLTALRAAVDTTVNEGDWVVISGSVPPLFENTDLVALINQISARGAFVAIDGSGDALVAAVATRPNLIKPNRTELSELVGRELDCIADVISAAAEIHDRGIERVLVSLGADGAVLVSDSGVLVGESSINQARSTVGAGDCFLAGFLSRFARDPLDEETALIEALAWGSAAAGLPGTSVPAPGDIAYTHVHLVRQPDMDRPFVAG
jgi:1-phosphofructokinase